MDDEEIRHVGRQEALGGAATRVSIKNFSKDATDLVRELEDFGWVFRRSNHGVVGRAPNDKTTTSISRNLRKSNHSYQRARADFRRWLRSAHPELVDAALAYINDADNAADLAHTDPVTAEILHNRARTRAATSINDVKRHQTTPPDTNPDTDTDTDTESETPSPMLTATATTTATTEASHVRASSPPSRVIKTEPWRPKNSSRDTFLRATKQVWSDGTVNYRCAESGCFFTSPNPRSVTQHFGANHTRTTSTHTLSPKTTSALEELREQLASDEPPVSSSAEEAAESVAETEPAEAAEVEVEALATAALSVTETLAEVQRLVSQPLLAQIADLKGQISTLLDENAELALSCSKTQDALRQLQSDWDALRALIGGH